MKPMTATLICVIGFVLLAPHPGSGQDIALEPPPGIDLLQDVLQMRKACEDLIAVWEREAEVLIALTLAVGVLGILTGVFQKYENRGCRVATVIAGTLVSIITVVDNTVFPADHRAINNKALEARQKLDRLKPEIMSFDPHQSKENQLAWYHSVIDKLGEIRQLDADMPRVPSLARPLRVLPLFFDMGITVHAASGPFGEPSQFPERKLLEFEGRADSAVLTQAREESFQNAIITAAKRLDELHNASRPALPTYPITALRAYVAQIAHVEADSYSYSQRSRLYTYRTRIAIEKRFAESTLVGTFVNKATAEGQLTVPSDLGGTSTLVSRVRVRAPNLRDGDFWFSFRFARQPAGKAQITLEDIHVFEDGSSFATAWAFEVLVNRQLAFTVPRKRYDRGEKPGTYRMANNGKVDQIVATGNAQTFETLVLGYRPESDPHHAK
jgi:hypothetical protein